MAQCYVSTYKDHYRWQNPQLTLSAKRSDQFMGVLPREDIWFDAQSDNELDVDEVLDERVRRCNRKRYVTTYQLNYCKDMIAKYTGKPVSSSFENQLFAGAKKLYEPECRPKIAPPLPGSRKAYGYIRPKRNYTPLTNYQSTHGLTGYRILKGDYKAVKGGRKGAPANTEAGHGPNKVKRKHREKELVCDCCYCCKRV